MSAVQRKDALSLRSRKFAVCTASGGGVNGTRPAAVYWCTRMHSSASLPTGACSVLALVLVGKRRTRMMHGRKMAIRL